jgi:hypothetical protein
MKISVKSQYNFINLDVYEDLLMSIDLSDKAFSVFIAVSDDNELRRKIIEKYESELSPEIISYQLDLKIEKPNLEEIITKLLLEDTYLQRRARAVFTVTGIEDLNFINKKSGKSQQDSFFDYLQWTRNNLEKLQYPIIIWVNSPLLEKLVKQAPDFWDWRKEVFRFLPNQNNNRPDTFFNSQQKQKLTELMDLWRTAQSQGRELAQNQQAELDSLVEAELKAATARSAALAQQVNQ